MIVYEFKVKGKQKQYRAIDEAIQTSQFIQNKCLRYWMDNKDVGRYDLNKYCAVLASEFPFADELNSMARQSAAERAWSAISRFYDNCKKKIKGKKGFPKFKKNCRSVEYKSTGWKLSETRKSITLSDKKGIGTLKLKGTYNLNYYDIKQIKRVRLVRPADGYYAQFAIDVEVRVETQPTNQVVGIDLGLKYFIADNKGNVEQSPQFYRQSQKQLNRANRKKSKKFSTLKKKAIASSPPSQLCLVKQIFKFCEKPLSLRSTLRERLRRTRLCGSFLYPSKFVWQSTRQSNNYHKARNRYARKHLKVSRQRKEYCKRLAYSVIQSNDLVAYEDLNVKGLVRNRHLAKSISDAGWYTFRQWLEYFGHKYGKVTVAVPPYSTSQNCSNCGEKVKKSLSTRTHICPHCGFQEDRDINAAINILRIGLTTVGHTGSYAWGDLPSWAVGANLLSNGESVNQESPRL